jgi:hypothetical protein
MLGYISFLRRIRDLFYYHDKSSDWITEETQFNSRHEKERFFLQTFPIVSGTILPPVQ